MSSHNHNKRTKHFTGFTLVEMLVVAPIVILMIGIFISAIVGMTGDVLSTRASNSMAYSIQDALNRIQSDVTLSGSFLATNNLPIGSPQGYNDDTTAFHNANATTGPVLILNTYATTSNPLNATRNLYYMANQPNSCSSAQLNSNPPVMLNVIYFVKNNTLWRRTIVPGNYKTVGCVNGAISAPWQKPSCAPTVTGTICESKDERLVDNVPTGGFSLSYFTTPSATTANATATDNSQSDSVRLAALQTSSTVGVTINSTTTIAGHDVAQTGTIRASSPNNNSTVTGDVVWSSLNMASGWTEYGYEWVSNGYRRTSDGLVTLKGLVKKSSAVNGGETLATLPVGYRPAQTLIFDTSTDPNVPTRVDITASGQIKVWGSQNWISLTGLNFIASDTPYTVNTMSTLNSWVPHGDEYSDPTYSIDASGRVYTKGLVKNGGTADGTPIVYLPNGARPSQYHHIPEHNSGSAGTIGIDANGSINAKGGGNGYLSLQSIFYPSGYTGWSGLVLQNSWIAYDAANYSNPQYTKSPDGMVTLHGLIKNGTMSPYVTIIANLPAGYRPTQRIMFTGVAGGAYSRIDLAPDGNLYYVSGTNGWYSLDEISFYAG